MDKGAAPLVEVNGTYIRRPSARREKAELRGAMQDEVRRYTHMLRERLLPTIVADHPDWTADQVEAELDFLQPLYDEFDPVIQLALVGANHSNSTEVRLRALSESAQYVRPKLKSIELGTRDDDPEEQAARRELMARMRGLLDVAQDSKRTIEGAVVTRDSSTDRDGGGTPGESGS